MSELSRFEPPPQSASLGLKGPQEPNSAVPLNQFWEQLPQQTQQTVLQTLTRMIQQALPETEVSHD